MCYRGGEAVRKFDIFGAPIGLNYKGENTFSTRIGGLCTLILYTILINLAVDDILSYFFDKTPPT